MLLRFFPLFASLLPIALGDSGSKVTPGHPPAEDVCAKISRKISTASDVYYPGNPEYTNGIYHWSASSSQASKCVVEPGTASDVGIVLGILGSTRTPFGVKGGGHTLNPGFSSTTGVQIYMIRFSDVVFNASSQTVEVGAGLIWDDVYSALEKYNVNVVGGRVAGIGVAGFTLGGGFSWKTNQYGLTIDTVTAFELVKPNGEVATVTQASDSDLFFGLKGSFNNFGIVTKFTLQTFPQTEVWGGFILYASPSIAQVTAATATFAAKVQDPKVGMEVTYGYSLGQQTILLLLFYDAPSPPAGIFDEFLSAPSVARDVDTRSFASMIQVLGPDIKAPAERGVFNAVSLLSYTPDILAAVINETTYWGSTLGSIDKAGASVGYTVEPFLPSIYSHNTVGSTAYPPIRSLGLLPFNLYFAWNSSIHDDVFYEAARLSAAHIHNVAVSQGQTSLIGAPVYPNNAIFDTPLKDIYGDNLPKLKALKAVVDPRNVMGLAGGFKF